MARVAVDLEPTVSQGTGCVLCDVNTPWMGCQFNSVKLVHTLAQFQVANTPTVIFLGWWEVIFPCLWIAN